MLSRVRLELVVGVPSQEARASSAACDSCGMFYAGIVFGGEGGSERLQK